LAQMMDLLDKFFQHERGSSLAIAAETFFS
jgi:hypothetical protein